MTQAQTWSWPFKDPVNPDQVPDYYVIIKEPVGTCSPPTPNVDLKTMETRVENDHYKTLDAFIAMGGEESGEGTIDTETLVKVLKQDFEMTVDIEQMIKNLDKDMSGKIDYDEFRYLLSSCM